MPYQVSYLKKLNYFQNSNHEHKSIMPYQVSYLKKLNYFQNFNHEHQAIYSTLSYNISFSV